MSCDFRLLKLSILFCFLVTNAFGQTDNCECKKKQSITVCHLSIADFCDPASSFCEYSIDGDFMEPGIKTKLENLANFGSNGVVDCTINTKPLTDFSSVEAIEDCGCDIIFTGNFPYDTTLNFTTDFQKTSVPQFALENIKEWSEKCVNNLVVVTQAEAVPWGYTVQNQNVNPNIAVGSNNTFSIFDGPFGTISEFSQGGFYQGTITQMPTTGAEILSRDANNLPTAVIDNATNDIVLGDIGIFCSDPAGPVSIGSGIVNNNDILACNIFALGCLIVQSSTSSFQLREICEGDTIVLDNGQLAFLEGRYLDTLATANGCDSIVTTEIRHRFPNVFDINLSRCFGEGFSVRIGGTDYNEANPNGQEILIDQFGCDSTVNINIDFFGSSSFEIKDTICENGGFSIVVGNEVYDDSNPTGQEILVNRNNCDSIVEIDLFVNPISTFEIFESHCQGDGYTFILNGQEYNESRPTGAQILENQYKCDSIILIDLNFEPLDSSFETIKVCDGEIATVGGVDYPAGTVEYSTYSRIDLCDSINKFEVVSHPIPIIFLDSNIIVSSNSSYQIQNEIPDGFQVNWFPSDGLSCSDCPNPTILNGGNQSQYSIRIIDDNNCIQEFNLPVSRNKTPYIPSAFSPNNDGINDFFQIFFNQSDLFPIIKSFQVYDRWGGLLYYEKDLDPFNSQSWWNGTTKGKKLDIGVYVYLIKVEYPNGEKLEFSGDISLIR